jgi:tRNA (guanine37-N1)-methyltransferase
MTARTTTPVQFSFVTLFPEVATAYVASSMFRRAERAGLLRTHVLQIRDFTTDKHHLTDESPYGGGPGMVMKAEPILRAVAQASKQSKISAPRTLVVITDAAGKSFSSAHARQVSKKYRHIIFVAGHYEGIDARLTAALKASGFTTQHLSIGDYVLTGGELPSLVIADALLRHIPGVLGDPESLEESRGGVGIPAYTRPPVFVWPLKSQKKHKVPPVLQSGNHKLIEEWRNKKRKK